MKALITGISGFAGNYLAKLLIEEGIEVYGVSQEKEFTPFLPFDGSLVHYAAIDVRDCVGVRELLKEIRPDLVFHLAAKSSPSDSKRHPEETYSINFNGTLAVLEAIRLQEVRTRFLLVSSSHVYGTETCPGTVNEDSPLRPETPYAGSKAAAEMAAYQYWKSFGIETIRVRAFNHTGPGQQGGFVCPDLARKVVEIERGQCPPTLELLNADQSIDFSDVRDIVRGYYRTLTVGSAGAVYNLCSGRTVSLRWVAETLAAKSQTRVEVKPVRPVTTAERGRVVVGDCSRACRDIGWSALIPFEKTLEDVLQYWRFQHSAPSHTSSSVSGKKTSALSL
jgi:GDP-4-dehydro-6-deoxy-D-mannose reductase